MGMRNLATILLSLILCGLSMAETLDEQLVARVRGAKPARILFLGNSYSFKIPKAFAELAKREGRKVVVAQETKGGWTLAKHAKAETTMAKIRSGKWDVVVLQEQSQMPAFGKGQREEEMIPAAKTLVAEIRKAGAIPVFFLTWGRRDGDKQNGKAFPDDTMETMQGRLLTGYREAADAAGGAVLVPVGPAWQRAGKAGHLDRLFAKDGSHPAADGVYLGACVFYTTFYDVTIKKATAERKALARFAGPDQKPSR